MCLYVKADAVAHVAKKDIVVYKIVRRRKDNISCLWKIIFYVIC